MKKLTALSVLAITMACATAHTAAQPSSAKKQFDEAKETACATQGKANALSAARGWGATLLNDGVMSRNPRIARAQRQLAADCYHQALKIAPDDAKAIEGLATIWGLEAAELASTDLPAARVLWQLAYDRYTLALKLNPQNIIAASNLAAEMTTERAVLLKASPAPTAQTIAQADELLQRARIILLGLSDDSKASVAYNIACMYALDGKAADALLWLQRSHSAGSLPQKSYITQDSDFDGIRSTPAFAAWFAQLR